MSEISELNINGIDYTIKDAAARAAIENIQTALIGATELTDEILETIGGEG